MKQTFFVVTALLSCLFFSRNAYAYGFTLSESEFRSWDERCKKAYSITQVGRVSGHYPPLTPQQISDARRFGEEAGGAWHYCAGIIWLQRASSITGKKREEFLKSAENEIRFTFGRIKPEHQWYPEIHVDYAKAQYLLGNKMEAFSILNRLIGSHPINSLPYTALAYYLKQDGQLAQAINTLKAAPAVLLTESAELNYFLGWYLMEAGKPEDAVPYAQKAYALNYPALALRQRLAAKGHSF